MPEKSSATGRDQVVVGLIVVALGLILLIHQASDLRIADFGRLWPLILVAIGVSRLFGVGDVEQRRSGYLLLFLGGWLLINTLGLFGLHWGVSWPLVLIAIGLARLFAERGLEARGALLVFFGLILQAIVLGLFGLDWHRAWPLLIVIAGLWIILRALGLGRRSPTPEESE